LRRALIALVVLGLFIALLIGNGCGGQGVARAPVTLTPGSPLKIDVPQLTTPVPSAQASTAVEPATEEPADSREDDGASVEPDSPEAAPAASDTTPVVTTTPSETTTPADTAPCTLPS